MFIGSRKMDVKMRISVTSVDRICDWCGKLIPAGEKCARVRIKDPKPQTMQQAMFFRNKPPTRIPRHLICEMERLNKKVGT
jgi:hypothetical protein